MKKKIASLIILLGIGFAFTMPKTTYVTNAEEIVSVEETISTNEDEVIETESWLKDEDINLIVTSVASLVSAIAGVLIALISIIRKIKSVINETKTKVTETTSESLKQLNSLKRQSEDLKAEYKDATSELKNALLENKITYEDLKEKLNIVESLQQKVETLIKAFEYMVTTDTKLVKGNRAKEIVKIIEESDKKINE